MLKKSFLVGGVLGICALALAAGALLGARGQGVARSEDQREATFRLQVTKLTSDPPRLGGDFVIDVNGRNARHVAITLRKLRDLQVGGPARNVCEFSGAAVMRVATPTGVQTVEGVLEVRVLDHREGSDDSGRDQIRVGFHRPGTEIRYEFAGAVTRGDIDVFVRTRD
ncbi:MAG: hypothetical protein M9921_15015 [Fimbriimonadaceae bacterium]|nr:hypothetical protein [Fimbriimonadaceae bacterium]